VKRATAIGRLTDVVDGLDRGRGWPNSTLTAAYVFGAVLEPDAELDRVDLVFGVDEPPDAVPWMSRPAHLEAFAASLRFTKLPLSWHWRPVQWPVWNHEISRAVRFWTTDGGGDERVLAALGSGRLDDVAFDAPADRDALAAQLVIERDVSRRQLSALTASFYDQAWRRGHRGDGVYPEDHLWRAAAGFVDLDDAISRLGD
jgi:hypothetical protein